ncbi:MAG: AAA family ATPase [Armatimonadia bacterium]|nr:AAA family ATPase [Armatimonadia bacterium]
MPERRGMLSWTDVRSQPEVHYAMPKRTKGNGEANEERGELDLRLELKHFGPIEHADVQLAPLTVLIGPNNSGKSFFALALHAILGWQELWGASRIPWFRAPEGRRFVRSGLWSSEMQQDHSEAIRAICAGDKAEATPLAEAHIAGQSTDPLEAHIVRLYQCPPHDLRAAWGRKRLGVVLRCRRSEVALSVNREGFSVQSASVEPLHALLDEKGPSGRISFRFREENGGHEVALSPMDVGSGDERGSRSERELGQHLLPVALGAWARQGSPSSCHYLPAGRAGIMQAYDSIVSAVLQNASQAAFGMEIPQVPGATVEFLSALISDPRRVSLFESKRTRRTPIQDATNAFEAAALNGAIRVDYEDEGPAPSFVYESPVGDLPLVRASSSVLEIAPLSIYLRRHVRPGDLLIIEEPEAHLHPANQRRMARLLASLIRAGVFVLITTHSDYMVEQLRALRMAGELEPKERKKLLEEQPDAYLQGDDLGIYLFDGPYDDQGEFTGSTARRLPWMVEDDDGAGYYDQVDLALYDEVTTLERRVLSRD